MRRGLDDLGSRGGFLGNRAHRVHEQIALLLRFRFGGLNHHRARHDQRERRRVRMEAVVDQALGDVHRVHAVLFLPRIAENHFVHRGQIERQVVHVLELLANVIRVQDRVFRGLADARAVGQRVGERAHQHSEISAERAHPANGFWLVIFERQVPVLFDQDGNRQIRLENFLDHHRARARTAAAVRRGKCLVQIQVHHVHAKIAGARDAGQRVHVRAVHVQQRAVFVQDFGGLGDILLEDAERRGIRDHHGGHVLVHDFLQARDVDLAAFIRAARFRRRIRRSPRSRDWCRARSRESKLFCAGVPACLRGRRESAAGR